jgi:iron complex transport system substrate-binding protein
MRFRQLIFSAVFVLFVAAAASAGQPERIVSLAPNVTEMLYALGLGDKIVGVTNFCDHPAEARKKPKMGGMIDPSLEAVLSARPDIVIMTTDGNPEGFEERLNKRGIKTYVLYGRRLSELSRDIVLLGRALGVGDKAESLATEIKKSLNAIRSDAARSAKGKSVLFVISPEPLIVAGPGTLIDDAIKLLGWNNMASDSKTNYPKFSIEEVVRRSPDAIIIGMAANMDTHSRNLLKRLQMVDAVRKGRVYYVNDDLYRLGPRVVRGLREMAGQLK